MKISAFHALYEVNPMIAGGFLSQSPAMWIFDVFFAFSLNKLLKK